MTLRFGLGIFTGQTPAGKSVSAEYRAMVDLACMAEDAGFDSVYVSEHHMSADSYIPSLLPVLAAIGARTQKIGLGTATALAPLYHPIRLAEDCAVVDQLTGGRLTLGLALGWRPEEFRLFGIPMSQRAGRLEETIEILRLAWSGEEFSFHGKYFSFERVRVTPKPFHPIPIWLGGTAPAAIRRAARLADGFVASPKNTLGEYEEILSAVAGWLAPERRAGFRAAAMLDAWAGRAPETVLAGLSHKLETSREWRTDETATLVGVAKPRATMFVTGEPDELVDVFKQFNAIGLEDLTVIVRLHYPGVAARETARAIERFGAEVIPRLCDDRV